MTGIRTARAYLTHDLFATSLALAFRDREHVRCHQSRRKVAKPISDARVLPPLQNVAQELVPPCEEAPAGWDSLRVEARLVELKEGFKRCLGLCNFLVEDGVDRLEEQLASVR